MTPLSQLDSWVSIQFVDETRIVIYNIIMFVLNHLDVIQIEKTGENFRLIYDVKGRFTIHRITNEEAKVCNYNINCLWYLVLFLKKQ